MTSDVDSPPRSPLPFAGQSAVVVGGAGGIGAAITAELLDRGARVLVVDLVDPDHTQQPWCHPRCAVLIGDATQPGTADAATELLAANPPALLVLSTIYQHERVLVDSSAADLRQAFEVMTVSTWLWGRLLVEHGDSTRPRAMVAIGSVHAAAARPGFGSYSTAKAAQVALVRTMALEWGPLAVRCNVVSPGFIAVPRNRDSRQDTAQNAARDARFALGRSARAEEVAKAVVFLLSDEASAITGVNLPVDAGLLARLP